MLMRHTLKTGAMNCKTCAYKFRFDNAEQLERIANSKGTSSESIAREIRCYRMNPSMYPFRDDDGRKMTTKRTIWQNKQTWKTFCRQ
ncbi:hypothetical protein KAR91_80410 [Candidatus Pacearchaeota archaeon]|nr:hypothetical protein [Candidatus Pacearchaeota archaeon]